MARALLLAAGAGGMAGAGAQSPSIVSLSVPAEVEHDSNPRMVPGPAPSTTWLRVMPSLALAYVRGADRFDAEAALTAETSSNPAVAKERLDPRLRLGWKHEDPRNATELAVLLDRSVLRTLDLPEQVALGANGSRTLAALTASWQHALDARTALGADARQEWQRFSDAAVPGYRRTTLAARLTRQHDERRSWYIGVDGQRYQPDVPPAPGAGGGSTVIGARAGLEQALSERWRIDASLGPVHFRGPAARTGWQGAARLDYAAERWEAGLQVARTPGVNPLAGGLVATTDMRVRLQRELDPLTRLEAEAGHASERAAGSRRTEASLAWVRQWSASWQLAVKASAHRQLGPQGAARSHRVGLLLVYSAPDF